MLSLDPVGVVCRGQGMLWAQRDSPTPAGCSGIQQLGAGSLSQPSRSVGTSRAAVTCWHCLTWLHPQDTASCEAPGLALGRGVVVPGWGAASSTSIVPVSRWDVCAPCCQLCSARSPPAPSPKYYLALSATVALECWWLMDMTEF